ncbi:MAG: molybdopterin-guanine dinucleotide biosynthesis protein B [Planctomycetes bacterium]|nr:molybdopterin-guanine dinucleotide biosynthesis protein B [Planctomycetota bacterium]MCB9920281.1 molybdopterin-guanine dinucleotide biosynthesis protein B [Planctomycetota bacterium]
MRALAFVAPSGTGKTTLLEATVAALVADGLVVAVLKASHHDHDLDHEGKDSWRMQRAGAAFVGLCGPGRTTFFSNSGRDAWPPVAEVAAWLAEAPFERFDVLLCEGFSSDPSVAKLRVVRGPWPSEIPHDDLVAIAWDGLDEDNVTGGSVPEDLAPAVARLPLDAARVARWIRENWVHR